MILSIITINRNNVTGLKQTLQSVHGQTFVEFEYIVVDGGSTDGSVELIGEYAHAFNGRMKWISEPDLGIYDAMNKGIKMATGDYLEFINSGDSLISDNVVGKITEVLTKKQFPSILYGNMIKVSPDGHRVKDLCFAGQDISFLGFYSGSLNHSPTFIKRILFEKYGLYDDSLKIVSDWKWYLQAIIFGKEKPVYTNTDVTLFDMTGISETNKDLDKAERMAVLAELIPAPILADYNNYSFAIDQFKRLKRHPWAYSIVWCLERILFKYEKAIRQRLKISEYK